MHSSAQIEMDFREEAHKPPISPEKRLTLQALLDQIQAYEPSALQLNAMLRSTSVHLSHALCKPLEALTIEELAIGLPEFGAFLNQRRFKRNSIRSYLNYGRILIQKARELGWREADPEVESLWQPLVTALSRRHEHTAITAVVRYAVQRGIKPSKFDDSQLNSCTEWMLKQGRAASYVSHLYGVFRSFTFRIGFPTALSDPNPEGGRVYGIPFHKIPEPLRLQIEQLLEWKVARFAHGRPERCRHRAVTAKNFRDMLCRIYGFLEKIKGQHVSTLEELLTEGVLRDFVEWSINKRQVKSSYFIPWLGMLYSSVRRYPPLKVNSFNWLQELIGQLPSKDAEIQKQEKKARKWVAYDVLREIPAKLREERVVLEKKDRRQAAFLARNELLITWLTFLPWRQRKVREAKLANRENGGNLFKSQISNAATIAKSGWIEEALRKNSQEAFWQFFFRAEETKTAHQVHALLPKQLIPLLEEYLQHYRPMLLNVTDPQTLFLNSAGRPISSEGMWMIVGNITRRYTGLQVNPHLFRDIFAVKWLEEHPEDYLTVSKILWHRNIQTTLKIYGRNFDESHGVRRVEDWLESRTALKSV